MNSLDDVKNVEQTPNRIYAVFLGNKILVTTHNEEEAYNFRKLHPQREYLCVMFKDLTKEPMPGVWIYYRLMV